MNEGSTSETDSAVSRLMCNVSSDFARKLKYERDEAREDAINLRRMSVVEMMGENLNVNHHVTEWENRCLKAERERDEALMDRANGDIATMTRNHYERILRERDEWAAMCGRYKQERDEVINRLREWSSWCVQYMKERDEAREALTDMLSGWKYIRQVHGDLYGVGWDRAQTKAEKVLEETK